MKGIILETLKFICPLGIFPSGNCEKYSWAGWQKVPCTAIVHVLWCIWGYRPLGGSNGWWLIPSKESVRKKKNLSLWYHKLKNRQNRITPKNMRDMCGYQNLWSNGPHLEICEKKIKIGAFNYSNMKVGTVTMGACGNDILSSSYSNVTFPSSHYCLRPQR